MFDVVAKIGFERRDMFIHFTSLDMKKNHQCVWKFYKAFLSDTCLQTTLGFSADACCQILFLLTGVEAACEKMEVPKR